MSGERIFVDTNVLLAATARSSSRHRQARAVVDRWPNRGLRLCVSGQVLREYLAVATRPPAANGLGLAVGDALANLAALTGRARLLAEDGRVARQLRALVAEAGCTGTRVHDANIVATALAHGVGAVLTANVADFNAFARKLEVRDLAKVDPGAL